MDNQRLILILVFVFSLFMLWEGWQKHNNLELRSSVTSSSQQNSAPIQSETPNPVERIHTASSSISSESEAKQSPEGPAQNILVKTDLFLAEISPEGGNLVKLELIKQKAADDESKPFVLMEKSKQTVYIAQTGLIGNGLPNHKFQYQAGSHDYEMNPASDTLEIQLEAVGIKNEKISKSYIFHRRNYQIDIRYEISNLGENPIEGHAYYQFVHDGRIPQRSMTNIATFTGPAIYTDEGKFQKIEFSDVEKNKAKFIQRADDGWLAMIQHYFVAGWIPSGNQEREFFVRRVANDLFAAGIITPIDTILPGQTKQFDMLLYAGPQEQAKLEKIATGFGLVVDYGWLTLIASPIYWLLEKIHRLVGNWGWAIILLTVLIKAVFFPLSAASYRSMAKMKLVTPKMMKIKEQFSSDRNRMNQEMMELYRKEKINPLGGCLPIMVQIPVFIALYWVLLGSVEMRHAPWVLWIHDLSAKDPYYVLPIIMGVSMLVQTRLNPTPPDPMQAKVMMAMPIVFTFMFLWFPSGLVLYWIVNNILSIAQQWQITRLIEGGKKKSG